MLVVTVWVTLTTEADALVDSVALVLRERAADADDDTEADISIVAIAEIVPAMDFVEFPVTVFVRVAAFDSELVCVSVIPADGVAVLDRARVASADSDTVFEFRGDVDPEDDDEGVGGAVSTAENVVLLDALAEADVVGLPVSLPRVIDVSGDSVSVNTAVKLAQLVTDAVPVGLLVNTPLRVGDALDDLTLDDVCDPRGVVDSDGDDDADAQREARAVALIDDERDETQDDVDEAAGEAEIEARAVGVSVAFAEATPEADDDAVLGIVRDEVAVTDAEGDTLIVSEYLADRVADGAPVALTALGEKSADDVNATVPVPLVDALQDEVAASLAPTTEAEAVGVGTGVRDTERVPAPARRVDDATADSRLLIDGERESTGEGDVLGTALALARALELCPTATAPKKLDCPCIPRDGATASVSGCRVSPEKNAVCAVTESSTAVAVKATGSIEYSDASSDHANVPETSVKLTPAAPGVDDTLRANTRGAEAPGAHRMRNPGPLLTYTVEACCGNALRHHSESNSNIKW